MWTFTEEKHLEDQEIRENVFQGNRPGGHLFRQHDLLRRRRHLNPGHGQQVEHRPVEVRPIILRK
jgi:hypothetical protein